ncbi:hypothetical protein TrRE_jg5547, partial [Triparma retinervis]
EWAGVTKGAGRGGAKDNLKLSIEAFDELKEQNISVEVLQQLTGFDDLTVPQQLHLTNIITSQTPIDHLGALLPNLLKLRLSHSTVPTFRDLGTRLKNLQVLWMPRCQVSDLSGVFGLPSLEELYLAFNDIEYLDDLAMHERLQVLDLEANRVGDQGELTHLGSCSKLTTLTLAGCPVVGGTEREYRKKVVKMVPTLEFLDDEAVCALDVEGPSQQQAGPYSPEAQAPKVGGGLDDMYFGGCDAGLHT